MHKWFAGKNTKFERNNKRPKLACNSHPSTSSIRQLLFSYQSASIKYLTLEWNQNTKFISARLYNIEYVATAILSKYFFKVAHSVTYFCTILDYMVLTQIIIICRRQIEWLFHPNQVLSKVMNWLWTRSKTRWQQFFKAQVSYFHSIYGDSYLSLWLTLTAKLS